VELNLPRDFNLADHLLSRALDLGWGDEVAFTSGAESMSYRRLAEEANRAGNLLRSLGVEAEQRVALFMLDSPLFVALFLGAIKIGAVPVPLNILLRPHECRYVLQDSRARVLVVSSELLAPLEGVLGQSPWLRQVLVSGEAPAERMRLEPALAGAEAELAASPTTADDVAFWLYTAGTTGFPKAVLHCHRDPIYCCQTYAREILEVTPSDVIFSVPKLFVAYGLGNSLFFPLYYGARAILFPGRPTPEAVLSEIARTRPTLFFYGPGGYAQILAAVEQGAEADLSSLRLCISSGEPLPADLYHRWKERFGLEILDGLGCTETLHIFLSNRPRRVRPGSAGRPVTGYEVRLEAEEGRPAAPGEIGDLLVRGDSISPGYWNQLRKTRLALRGEWLATGDKLTMDEEGYFWYVGRCDDMVKVMGRWVCPGEIEALLEQEEGVEQAAVVGFQDEEGLTRLGAFVVPRSGLEGQPDFPRRLLERLHEKVEPHQRLQWIELVPELPRTPGGRLQRYRLREGR
jgi:benzoate-CoA ligase